MHPLLQAIMALMSRAQAGGNPGQMGQGMNQMFPSGWDPQRIRSLQTQGQGYQPPYGRGFGSPGGDVFGVPPGQAPGYGQPNNVPTGQPPLPQNQGGQGGYNDQARNGMLQAYLSSQNPRFALGVPPGQQQRPAIDYRNGNRQMGAQGPTTMTNPFRVR